MLEIHRDGRLIFLVGLERYLQSNDVTISVKDKQIYLSIIERFALTVEQLLQLKQQIVDSSDRINMSIELFDGNSSSLSVVLCCSYGRLSIASGTVQCLLALAISWIELSNERCRHFNNISARTSSIFDEEKSNIRLDRAHLSSSAVHIYRYNCSLRTPWTLIIYGEETLLHKHTPLDGQIEHIHVGNRKDEHGKLSTGMMSARKISTAKLSTKKRKR